MPGELPPLKTEVTADSSGFVTGLGRASQSVTKFSGLLKAGTAALAAFAGAKGLAGATRQAIEFEEATAELAKLVGTRQADPLADSVQDMAEVMPVAREELFQVAETAARLGVRGEKDIREFTETAAKIGVATDQTAQAASNAFARISAMTQGSVEDMERLASAGNELSNTMATSFQEIVDASLRGAAAMSSFGLSQQEIFAVSASLNEVSESSRRAGTRLRRLAQELQDPSKVEDFAGVLGMTVDEFRQMRREAPIQIILGLARTMREGGDAADRLRSATTTVSRTALTGLGQNLDSTREALERSNVAFDEATSLQDEYGRFTDTAAARTKILRNRMESLQTTIGNRLLPVVVSTLEKMNFLAGAIANVFDQIPEGERPVTGIEAVEKALDKARIRADATDTEVNNLMSNIEEAAGRFNDAGNRATFLAQAMELARTVGSNAVPDFDALDVALGRLFKSLKSTESQADDTAGSIGGGDGVADATSDAAMEVERLLARLREQKAELKGNEDQVRAVKRELLEARLAELEVDEATRQRILTLFDEVSALQEQERAQEKATERLEEHQERAEDVRERNREITRQARQDTARFVRDVKLERIQSEFRRTDQAASNMAEGVADALESAALETDSVVEAFRSMVDSIIHELFRLAAQEAIISQLSGLFGSLIGGGIPDAPDTSGINPAAPNIGEMSTAGGVPGFQKGGVFQVGGQGGKDSELVSFRATPGELVAVAPEAAGGGGGGGEKPTQVQLNQEFNITTMDERGVAEFVRQNRGLFARPVLEEMRRSGGAAQFGFGG